MRRGDHDGRRPGLAGGMHEARRGDDADVEHVDARRRDAGAQRRAQHLPGAPRVAADEDARSGVAEPVRDGTPEVEGEADGDLGTDHTANAVRAEPLPHLRRWGG